MESAANLTTFRLAKASADGVERNRFSLWSTELMARSGFSNCRNSGKVCIDGDAAATSPELSPRVFDPTGTDASSQAVRLRSRQAGRHSESIRAASSDFEARRLLRQSARHRRERAPGTGLMLVPSQQRYQAGPLSKPAIDLCTPDSLSRSVRY